MNDEVKMEVDGADQISDETTPKNDSDVSLHANVGNVTPSVNPTPADFINLVDSGSIIQDNSWAIIQMPSENTKLVQFKSGSVINMGKFGSFRASELIGLPFDMPYEVYADKKAKPAPRIDNLDAFDLETEEGASNKDLIDRKESQKLSQVEIEQLKEDSLSGQVNSESVVKALIEGSETFQKKTEFSKAKYIKRKQRKFSKIFTPKRPTARGLCEHFFKENSRRICDIRIDTLSQMLTFGDVRAGGRYLVVDEAGGLLACALAERMQGQGTIFVLHEHETNNVDLVKYLNFPPSVRNPIIHLPWTRLTPNDDEDIEGLKWEDMDDAKVKRLKMRIKRLRDNRALLQAGGFDGLFVISLHDTKEIVDLLSPHLAGSRPIVIYSAFKEPLMETYLHFRYSRDFVNAQLTESWLREYQVLAGTHPLMRMSGGGGYLLNALTVIDCETIAASAKKIRVKDGKVIKVGNEDDGETAVVGETIKNEDGDIDIKSEPE